jgi:hypothetical protein
LNIELISIPTALTDEYQPLDRRFFVPMKQRARDLFRALSFTNFSVDPGRHEEPTMLVSVRIRFQTDDLLCAWSHLTQW